MSTLDKNTDDALRKKFLNPEQLPGENLWENINKHIPIEQVLLKPWLKNIFVNSYFYAIVGLVAVTGISYVIYVNSGQEQRLQPAAEIPEKTTIPTYTKTQVDEQASTNLNKTEKAGSISKPNEAPSSLPVHPSITGSSSSITLKVEDDEPEFMTLENAAIGIKQVGDNYFITGVNDTVGFRITVQPKNGQVVFDKQTGKFRYKPNKGFIGKDSFSYVIVEKDGTISNEGTINVKIEKETSCTSNFDFEMAAGGEVKFLNRSTINPLRKQAATYLWDFNDGSTSKESNPIHQFAKSNDYTVCLSILQGSCSDKICQTVSVFLAEQEKISERKKSDSAAVVAPDQHISTPFNQAVFIPVHPRNKLGQPIEWVFVEPENTKPEDPQKKKKDELGRFGKGNAPGEDAQERYLKEKKNA